jgi:hypothetical protein
MPPFDGPHWPLVVMLDGGPHVPKSERQSLPQWAVELPHQPWSEQQSPKALPPQTNLFVPPQEPSGDTLPGPRGLSGGGAAALQLPALGWLGLSVSYVV